MKLLAIVEEDNHPGSQHLIPLKEKLPAIPLMPCLVWWGLEGIKGG
jgi:hypothetical protein